ncbi:MAG: ATP-dependent DNA helicase RecG [Alphaproteobacteria bacterium]|nr:ATP-dependent DNA helicase RecG [Alphaproteobacteria bacterium]
MRPDILFPLFAPLTSLKGVGAKLAPLYERLLGTKIIDILWHLPTGLIDRRTSPALRDAQRGQVVTLTLEVLEHKPPAIKGKPYRIIATDGIDNIALTYFAVKADYLANLYPLHEKIVVSGTLEYFGRGFSINHPDYALPIARRDEIPALEPVYPLTEGISRKMIGKLVRQALALIPKLPEWLDPSFFKQQNWPVWDLALRQTHHPESSPPSCPPRGLSAAGRQEHGDLTPEHNSTVRSSGSCCASPEDDIKESLARRRLAYDELLADQLALAVIRRHHRHAKGRAFKAEGLLQEKLHHLLPFSLTKAQEQAFEEIRADMSSSGRMLRLLQGDVSAGKTIVALKAMLHALEAGSQAAFMAPTEILARQHYERLSHFLKPLNIEIGLILGKGRSKDRAATLEALEQGTLKLVVGTHALFQSDVTFADLGLAVMDEQHRFGVHQRLLLADKGRGVDILAMTATPIPRTLTLTAYGDMDVSRMMEKPAARKPIDTRLVDMRRLEDVIEALGRALGKGAQAYWVCPLVEETEKSDLAAATQRADLLASYLGEDKVGLIHGRLPAETKDKTMQAFAAGEIRLLVATTVIEVGIDVPAASLMIVEHSERFGLAQLHQLRGRIGRGQDQSTCLLLYQAPLGEVAQARLKTLRETEDGFQIAEEDLRLRGPGEVLGTRQSGAQIFRLADLSRDQDLLTTAHNDAKLVLARDPDLKSPRGIALRTLLYLFEKDAAVRLFRSG